MPAPDTFLSKGRPDKSLAWQPLFESVCSFTPSFRSALSAPLLWWEIGAITILVRVAKFHDRTQSGRLISFRFTICQCLDAWQGIHQPSALGKDSIKGYLRWKLLHDFSVEHDVFNVLIGEYIFMNKLWLSTKISILWLKTDLIIEFCKNTKYFWPFWILFVWHASNYARRIRT